MTTYSRVILAVLASASVLISIWRLVHRKKHWRTAKGTIVDIEEDRDSDSPTRRPIVKFAIRNGQEIVFRERVSSNLMILRKGSRVELRYDPHDPTKAVITGWREYFFPLFLALLAGSVIAWAFDA